MLDGSPAHSDENQQPVTFSPGGGNHGLNPGSRPRQALLKKGGRKLHLKTPRSSPRISPRNSPNSRLCDHNNNTVEAQPGTEPPAGTSTGLSLHHLKQGAKKELLKPKGGRLERGAVQTGNQPARNLPRHDQTSQTMITRSHKPKQGQNPGAAHSTKKKETSSPSKPLSLHQSPLREQKKKPLHASDNVKSADTPPAEATPEYLKDGEKVYAGAKFSEPPSPSVLPKPPSHWVGEDDSQQSNQRREQMTVHLKSLLKVQDQS